MSSLYTEIIQDAYRHPQHKGEIAEPTHSYEDENPLCGDTLRIQLRVEDGRIAEARFDGRGCAISQAAAELLLDRIQDQPLDTLADLGKDDVLEELGLPAISPARLKCALLSLSVLRRALQAPPQ
jgi:nitrogen fixation NifU-like protein